MPGVKMYEQILGKYAPTTPSGSTAGSTNLFAQANTTAGSTTNSSAEGQPATVATATSDSTATVVSVGDTSSANTDIFSRIIMSRDSFTKAYGDCTRYADLDDLVSKVVAQFKFNLIL